MKKLENIIATTIAVVKGEIQESEVDNKIYTIVTILIDSGFFKTNNNICLKKLDNMLSTLTIWNELEIEDFNTPITGKIEL